MRKRSGGPAVLEPPDRPVKWFEPGGSLPFDSEDVAVFDAAPLNGDQRNGEACVSCNRRWPRPPIPVGRVPAGDTVRACEECAPGIHLMVHGQAVRRVLQLALERADRCAPSILAALIASAPSPMRTRPRHAVEAAVIVTARHVQATEILPGKAHLWLPTTIEQWDHAYAWLDVWATSDPPPAVIREVLTNVLAGLPAALAQLDGPAGGR